MTYGTIFLNNFKFNEDYNYGCGVYIGPAIKREYIRKIKYEIESDYIEAYYGFDYNKFDKNKIFSFIYDLNDDKTKKRISDFKAYSDIFKIKQKRITDKIMDSLEILDSDEKMYSIIFEILPFNSKLFINNVYVNDINSNNEILIESIIK